MSTALRFLLRGKTVKPAEPPQERTVIGGIDGRTTSALGDIGTAAIDTARLMSVDAQVSRAYSALLVSRSYEPSLSGEVLPAETETVVVEVDWLSGRRVHLYPSDGAVRQLETWYGLASRPTSTDTRNYVSTHAYAECQRIQRRAFADEEKVLHLISITHAPSTWRGMPLHQQEWRWVFLSGLLAYSVNTRNGRRWCFDSMQAHMMRTHFDHPSSEDMQDLTFLRDYGQAGTRL